MFGLPTKLAFVQGLFQSSPIGATITPPVTVAIEDVSGNVETAHNSTTVTRPSGRILAVCRSSTRGLGRRLVASGSSTFSPPLHHVARTGYTLTASSTPARTAATSAAFNITSGVGPPTKLAFVQGPSNAATGATI